jgi:hypothetical protein
MFRGIEPLNTSRGGSRTQKFRAKPVMRRLSIVIIAALLGACASQTGDPPKPARPAQARHYTVSVTLLKDQPLYEGQFDVRSWMPVHAALEPVYDTAFASAMSARTRSVLGAELSLICQAPENAAKLICDLQLETREPRANDFATGKPAVDYIQAKSRVTLEIGKQSTSPIGRFQLAMKATPSQ